MTAIRDRIRHKSQRLLIIINVVVTNLPANETLSQLQKTVVTFSIYGSTALVDLRRFSVS
jgi:hypothetical protein